MKNSSILLAVILFVYFPSINYASTFLNNMENNSSLPVKSEQKIFLKNNGQWSSEILYDAQLPEARVRFLKSGLSFGIKISDNENAAEHSVANLDALFELPNEHDSVQIFNLFFTNCNANVNLKGNEEKASVFSFMNHLGNFPNVPETNSIRYADIYTNIDIDYYTTTENKFEYDIVLKPGAKVTDIVFSYDGIKNLLINEHGELVINTGRVTLIENMPLSYQNINGTITEVSVKYKLISANSYGFEITGENYDPKYDLIIDPFVRKWGTYLRINGDGYSYDHVTDNQGYVYSTGWIAGQYTTTSGTVTSNNLDAYVAKLTPNGNNLVFFTLIGGNYNDIGYGIDVDNAGAPYITGSTVSINFPHILTGYGNLFYGGTTDAFVTKLNPLGNAIVYSRFIGGNDYDIGRDIVVDDITLIPYVTGYTNSTNFTTTSGVVQNIIAGSNDAFVIAIDPILTSNNPVVSTLYGGLYSDGSYCIYRNATNGDIYIAGFAQPLFPVTVGAYQTTWGGGTDGFIARLNSTLSIVNFSTYLGGSALEEILGLDVNNSGEVFVTGYTFDNISSSPHFPTTVGVLQPISAGGIDGFVSKLNNSGTNLLYSTFLGGNLDERGTDIKAGTNSTAYVTGYTGSLNFPTTSGNFQSIYNGGSNDIFLSQINPTGTGFDLSGSTFIGGNLSDYAEPKISIDRTGCSDTLVINGTSHSTNFPVSPGAYQTTNISTGGNDDQPVFIKFSVDTCIILGDPRLVIGTPVYEDTVCSGTCFTIKFPIISGIPTPLNLQVQFPGSTVNYYNTDTLRITICNANPGNLQLFIFQNLNIANYPPIILNFTVLPSPSPFSLGPDRLICPGSAITLSTPALNGITYSWTGPGINGYTAAHVSVSQPGVYSLQATNAAGCSVKDTIRLFTLDDMPNTFVTYNNCYISNGVQLDAGYGAVSYSWSPATGLNNPAIQNPFANPSVTITYTVIATFANGCTDTGDVIVTLPPVPVYSIGGPLTVCEGSCVKLTTPKNMCIASAVWFLSPLHPFPNNTDIFLGNGSTICTKVTRSGNYCVKIITCDGCEYLLCRTITVVSGKDCKNIPVTDDRCCSISTERSILETEEKHTVLAVQPNPVKDNQLNILFKTDEAATVKVRLLNTLGQVQTLLFTATTDANTLYEQSIDVSTLSSGIYFITLETNELTKTIKFVKE